MFIKKKLPTLMICTATSVSLVVALFIYSESYNHAPNHFIRYLPSHLVDSVKTIDLGFNSYYVAGLTNRFVYLGNTTAPTHLLKVDYALKDTQHLQLDIPNKYSSESLGNRIMIDSPFIFLTNNKNVWYYSDLSGQSFTANQCKEQNIYTTFPISAGSVIFKRWDSALAKNILVKQSTDPSLHRLRGNVLEKQIDGIFCTDGILDYNADSGKLFYAYYYRNQFICMDTNLTVLYKTRTIDTTTYANVKIETLSSGKELLSAPPHIVNRYISVSDAFIFICSPQKADNEDRSIFQLSDVIDMYKVSNGQYIESFYLPRYKGNKLHDFKMRKHHAVALNGNFISTYFIRF